jgi:DNA-directed RNA polymerase specialized sigma24 family protein
MERPLRPSSGRVIGLQQWQLERTRRDQANLVEQLASQHAETLVVLAARLVGQSDAQDVAQDAFISLTRWIMKKPLPEATALLESPEALRRFMFRITACRAYDFWRARGRREELAHGDEIDEVADEAPCDPGLGIDLGRLERAYDGLPPAQRIAHVLHHYYGFTDAEFEATLGLTRTNSRTLVRRANLALRRAMKGER